jgi:hypothetical protein
LAYNARPIIFEGFPAGLNPIVQVIDNFSRNLKLGLLFEAQCGNGRIIISASDVLGHLDLPEVRQYYNSILEYAASPCMTEIVRINPELLRSIFPL